MRTPHSISLLGWFWAFTGFYEPDPQSEQYTESDQANNDVLYSHFADDAYFESRMDDNALA